MEKKTNLRRLAQSHRHDDANDQRREQQRQAAVLQSGDAAGRGDGGYSHRHRLCCTQGS